MENVSVRVNARHGVWYEENYIKSSNNRELRNLLEVVDEGVEAVSMEGAEFRWL